MLNTIAECRVLFSVTVNVIMLRVVMLSFFMLYAFMLGVVGPLKYLTLVRKKMF